MPTTFVHEYQSVQLQRIYLWVHSYLSLCQEFRWLIITYLCEKFHLLGILKTTYIGGFPYVYHGLGIDR